MNSSSTTVEFEYEITADDYAAASILSFKLSRNRLTLALWLFAGLFLVLLALLEKDRGWSPILLGAVGVWWMWAGIARLFPGESFSRHYRKRYQQLSLRGRKYTASLTDSGFQVAGENSSWRIPWSDVSQKGEDNRVFMFYCRGVLFIFAKRSLGDEQQSLIRTLSGLPSA